MTSKRTPAKRRAGEPDLDREPKRSRDVPDATENSVTDSGLVPTDSGLVPSAFTEEDQGVHSSVATADPGPDALVETVAVAMDPVEPTGHTSSVATPGANADSTPADKAVTQAVPAGEEDRAPAPSNLTWASPCGAEYPGTLTPRLQALLALCDSRGHRYSPTNVPASAKWGIGSRTDVMNTLCVDNKPVSIIIVGELQSKWFCSDRGVPHANVSISLTPICAAHLGNAKALMAAYSRYHGPPKVAKRADVLWMGRYQVVREKGVDPEPVHFKHVYDAQDGYGARKAMRQIGHIGIDVNDLVIVECRLTRYKCDSRTGNAVNTGGWSTWRTSLELQAVSLLLDGPVIHRSDSDSEDEHDTSLI